MVTRLRYRLSPARQGAFLVLAGLGGFLYLASLVQILFSAAMVAVCGTLGTLCGVLAVAVLRQGWKHWEPPTLDELIDTPSLARLRGAGALDLGLLVTDLMVRWGVAESAWPLQTNAGALLQLAGNNGYITVMEGDAHLKLSDVQEFAAWCAKREARGMVVSAGVIPAPVYSFALRQPHLRLVDLAQILEWLYSAHVAEAEDIEPGPPPAGRLDEIAAARIARQRAALGA